MRKINRVKYKLNPLCMYIVYMLRNYIQYTQALFQKHIWIEKQNNILFILLI